VSDDEFHKRSDEVLSKLQRALERASERYEFEVDRNQGALTIEFDDPPAKFVVSPNSPVRQIWVSARVQSFKLDWDDRSSVFALPDGRSLTQLMADVIGQQLNESVSLDF
jgi:iron donor protein CyaY